METNPRTKFAEIIENIPDNSVVENFAVYLRQEKIEGRTPCWGAIAEYFQDTFVNDSDRLVIWPSVKFLNDTRVTGLFVQQSLSRTAVMTQVISDIAGLPLWVQKALVCRPEFKAQIEAVKDKLRPEARQLFESGEEAIAKEIPVIFARLNQLLSYKYFAPDVLRPGEVGE